ncbi:MAG: PEP/pyruvate-binding domain-containing protein [Streptosporangiaceae bacterium]
MTRYVLDLAVVGRDDAAVAGGKAAGLGRLLHAGLPVPPGFVITTAAYTAAERHDGTSEGDGRTADRLRQPTLPDQLVTAISSAYEGLGSPPVAVRSSGTAEDLTDASFAGQHDTYLNVVGTDDVIDAVRKCWASLCTPRAVAYRHRHGWDERGLAMAVVVQRMVDAEWSGVVFTAEPVSGRRDRMVIEAVRGLGDVLVSGEARGEHLVMDSVTGRPTSDGSPIPIDVSRELVRLAGAAQLEFGVPMDLEWGYAAGRCFLLQARPLTALPDKPLTDHNPRPRKRRHRLDLRLTAENNPYPPYPMDWSLLLRPAVSAVLDALHRAGFATPRLEEFLAPIDDGVVQFVPQRVRPTVWAALGIPRALPTLARALSTSPSRWRRSYDSTVAALAARFDAEDLAELSERALQDRVLALRRAQAGLVLSRFGCVTPGMLAGRTLEGVLRRVLGRERGLATYNDLMSGTATITGRANDDLVRIAGVIRTTPRLAQVYRESEPTDIPERLWEFAEGRALLDNVAAHLHRYGQRQLTMAYPGFRPLREAPATLHGLLQGLLRVDPTTTDGAGHAARARRLPRDLGPLAPLVRRLADAARAGVRIREDSLFFLFMVPAAAQRHLLRELGRRLVADNLLTVADDVFFLTWDEATGRRAGLKEVVARRRAARKSSEDRYTIVPVEYLRSDDGSGDLHGVSASSGTAAGRVRVIRDASQFPRLRPGEILVCPYTNPTWTPLFSVAAAVVADTGGVASHAAIVAREHHMPAVMGTFDGTRRLIDGQRVLVDGDRGSITVIDPRPAR